MFEKIKKYYELGFYTKAQVKVFVDKRKITPDQYKIITGETYN